MREAWRRQLDQRFSPYVKQGSITYEQLLSLPSSEATEERELNALLYRLEEENMTLVSEFNTDAYPIPTFSKDEEDTNKMVQDYLVQVSDYPLLEREQEIEHARRLDIATKRLRQKILSMGSSQKSAQDTFQQIKKGFSKIKNVFSLPNIEEEDIQRWKALKKDIDANIDEFDTLMQPISDYVQICQQLEAHKTGRINLFKTIRRKRRYVALHLENYPLVYKFVQDNLLVQLRHRRNQLDVGLTEQQRLHLEDWLQDSIENFASDMEEIERLDSECKIYQQPLYVSNLRMVLSIAKMYGNRGVSFVDLVEAGNQSVLKALGPYSHRKGYRFGTYATWWIRQALESIILNNRNHG